MTQYSDGVLILLYVNLDQLVRSALTSPELLNFISLLQEVLLKSDFASQR